MERPDLLRQQLAEQPLDAIVDKMLALEEQLRQREEELAEAAFIAELKCHLFGKTEKLTPEQGAHVQEIVIDLEEQQQQPEPLSKQVLKEERKIERERRPVRHPLTLKLETETVVLEPEITRCSCCGRLGSHRGGSQRRDGLGAGQADSSHHTPQVCRVPLRPARHDHCTAAAALDPAKPVGIGLGGIYSARPL